MGHHRMGLLALCSSVFACVLLAQPAAAQRSPEQEKEALIARPVGLDGLPSKFSDASASAEGDLLLVHDASSKPQPKAISRVIAASTMFQIDPVVFSEPELANMRLEHVAQSAQQTMWGVGASVAVAKRAGMAWEKINLGAPIDAQACRARRHFDGTCQLVVPLSNERAVVLRPVFEQRGELGRVLSTQVIAVVADQPQPLARVTLPNVVMGPAVQDGKGGFWVMIQRVQLGSNYKPMRGYLHYTADGFWLLWSDSGESIEGTKFMGRAGFLIDPQVRKMSSDGQGGFLAIGKDRKLYRVDEQGKVARFSDAVPSCQYCQPLSVAYDFTSREVHLLMAKWRGGEARDHKLEEPLRWLRFGQQGELEQTELVPLPEQAQRKGLGLYASMRVLAGARNAWILGQDLLMHRDLKEWSWIDSVSKVDAHLQKLYAQGKLGLDGEPAEPVASDQTLKHVGMGTSLALTTGTMAASFALSDQYDSSALLLYVWGVGALATYYPATWYYPYVVDTGDPDQLRWMCLGAGVLAVPLASAGATWFMGEYFESAYLGEYDLTGKSFLGALGGAAAGTLASTLLARLIYGADPNTEEWIVATLGAMLVSSGATLGYVLTEP